VTTTTRAALGTAGFALLAAAFFTADWVWLKAQLGGNDSQILLANAYASGTGGVEPDAEKAFGWYLRAAENGDPRAQQEVARRYDEGEGVGPDVAEATRWYQAAAEQSHPAAQFALAKRYREGRGVAQSNVQSAMWLILSGVHVIQVPDGIPLRDALRAELSEPELAQARGLAREWRTQRGVVTHLVDRKGNPVPAPALGAAGEGAGAAESDGLGASPNAVPDAAAAPVPAAAPGAHP
jgi:TPR repeat protein